MHASYNLQTLLEYQHLAFFVVYHLATSRVTKSFEFTQKKSQERSMRSMERFWTSLVKLGNQTILVIVKHCAYGKNESRKAAFMAQSVVESKRWCFPPLFTSLRRDLVSLGEEQREVLRNFYLEETIKLIKHRNDKAAKY